MKNSDKQKVGTHIPVGRVVGRGLSAIGLFWSASCGIDDRSFSSLDAGAQTDTFAVNPPTSLPSGNPDGSTPIGTDEPLAPGEVATVGPRLVVEPLALDLGAVVVDLAAVRSVAVSNTGDQVLDIPTVSLASGSAAEFSILQNGCQNALEPGESCAVNAQFLPISPGDFSGTISIESPLGGDASVSLAGTGLAQGALIVTPAEGSAAQFGRVLLGESEEASFVILNPSEAPSGPIGLGLNNPDFTFLAPGSGDCEPGTTSLVDGESCTIRVAFTPSLRERSEAILTVSSEGGGNAGLRLDGFGSAPGALVASEERLSVQAVFGQATQVTLSILNEGDEAVSLTGASIEADTPEVDYQLVESSCSGVLEGGATCQLVLEFKPNALGSRPATLLVTSEAGASLRIALVGEGLKPGALVIVPLTGSAPADALAVDFGPVRRDSERVLGFRVSNPGQESSGALEQLSASGDFSIVTPPLSGECTSATKLVNNESCDIRVRFRPTQRGQRDGVLTVVSVGAGSVALPLGGLGTVPANLSSAPSNVQLGSAILGETRSAVVTVTNVGDETASPPAVQVVGAGAEAFGFAGCTQPLAAQAACELALQFHPTNDPAHTGLMTPMLQIVSANGGSANVSLTARGLRPGSLDITPSAGGSVAFQAPVNGTHTQLYNVTNTGGVASGALTVSVANAAGRRNFELTGSGLATACQTGQSLEPGGSCSVGVGFRPVVAGTNFNATLSASSSAAGTDSIALTGVAQALATLASPNAVANFPNGASSPELVWRIDNTGDVVTSPLSLGAVPANFSLGTAGDCPLSQATGLPARTSCRLSVRFTPQAQPIQGQDQILRGTLTLNAGPLSVSLALTGTIPRALAGRGQSCAVDADCQPGLYSFCGNSGSNTLPNVCCDSPCSGNSCSGCTAGSNGGTCSARALQSACITSGTSRAGLCAQANTCTELCVLNQSVLNQCLLL